MSTRLLSDEEDYAETAVEHGEFEIDDRSVYDVMMEKELLMTKKRVCFPLLDPRV
jgi:hypothetical protein